MKIVIDIPDELYKRIAVTPRCASDMDAIRDRDVFVKAIQEGELLSDIDNNTIKAKEYIICEDDFIRRKDAIDCVSAMAMCDPIIIQKRIKSLPTTLIFKKKDYMETHTVDGLIKKIETDASWYMFDEYGNTKPVHDEVVRIIKEYCGGERE